MQTSEKTFVPTSSSELDLKVYARLVWHWAWLILLCTVTAGVIAYLVSIFSIPIYQAAATLLVDEARSAGQATYQDLLFSERIARTYAEWMKRPDTLNKVAERLQIETAVLEQGVTSVTVTPIRDTQLMNVVVEGIWPELLPAVANTLPLVFWEEIKRVQDERFVELEASLQKQVNDLTEQVNLTQIKLDDIGDVRTSEEDVTSNRLRTQLAQQQSSLANMQNNLEDLRLTKVQSSDSIVIVEKARLPTAAIRPRVMVNTLLAAIVGAMLALGLIFLVEYLDDRIKTPEDLLQLLNTAVLGNISRIALPKGSKELTADQRLISIGQPRNPITEAYRSLRTNLQFSSIDTALELLLVTSATPGEGKTTTAANLATVVAQSGRRVVLIDADLRKPQQHKLFALAASPGLTEALVASDAQPADYLHSTIVPNLQVITSGHIPPNPAELLGSQRMQQLLHNVRAHADLIIIDAPPLLPVTDAQVLATQVQGVLLVVRAGVARRTPLVRAVEALERVQARLLGVAINDLTRSVRSSYYYYDQYSHYYAEESPQTGAMPPQPADSTRSSAKRSANPFDLTLVGEAANNGSATHHAKKAS